MRDGAAEIRAAYYRERMIRKSVQRFSVKIMR
jgi:hypothetical protein